MGTAALGEAGLRGQAAWVTGAASGIGLACAERLAAAGLRLGLLDTNAAALQQVHTRLAAAGAAVQSQVVDVADAAAVEQAAEALLAAWGGVDQLVHCAGMTLQRRSFSELAAEDWDRLVRVNLSGAWHLSRAVLPTMRRQGHGTLVHIASMAGKQAFRVAGPAYTAAKHGLVGLAEAINAEARQDGLRACAICPGEVNTPILEHRPVPVPMEERERMIQPEDVAEAVVFVCAMPPRTCVRELLLWPRHQRGATL